MSLTRFAPILGLGIGLATGGCLDPNEDPTLGSLESQVAVSNYVSSGCSTAVVVGLSKQIAEEISCMNPGTFSELMPSDNVIFTSNAVLPFLSAAGKAKLLNVAANRTLQINSAFRTVAQQYLLYRWYQQGRCGITAAATPGRSNHQSGRALDLSNYSSVISAMSAQGWAHDVPGDPVHFDHLASPDIRGRDVKAFQRLWNRNHPSDKISEDGSYGPQTESRLKQSPATGFDIGPTCGTDALAPANVVMVEGPERVAPLTRAHFTVTLSNRSAFDWPASTKLRVVGGGSSALYDSASWTSASIIGELGSDIGAGAKGIIEFDVMTPDVTEETPAFSQMELTDGSDTPYGTFNLALTVTPDGDEDTSTEAKDTHDEGAEVTGGCTAGGGALGWWVMAMPALLVLRRRRTA